MKEMNLLSYKGYLGKFEFEPEAQVFYGRVININDTITFQSDDIKRIEEEFRISVDTYLEFCQELKESPDNPSSVSFVLKLTPEEHLEVVRAAQHANKNLNTWAIDHLIKNAQKELATSH